MSNTFMNAPRLLFTSESVTEGHPDKLCDQVSDAVLDAILAQDPFGRVAAEAATTTGLMCVMGEITTTAQIDFQDVVREAIVEAGYDKAEYGFDNRFANHVLKVDLRRRRDLAHHAHEAGRRRGFGGHSTERILS